MTLEFKRKSHGFWEQHYPSVQVFYAKISAYIQGPLVAYNTIDSYTFFTYP